MVGGQPAAALQDHPMQGVILFCSGLFCFVAMNTGVKLMVGTFGYPVIEVVWARYFFHLILIVVLFPRRAPRLLESERKPLQVLRSIFVLCATVSACTALKFLPLADMVSITFLAPLIVTGLSVVVLGETVGWRRWSAVLVGFAGVFIILRPGFGAFHPALLLPLAVAFFYACYQVTTRLIRGAAPPLNSLFYTALVGAVVMTATLPFAFRMPTPGHWAMLVALGFLGGLGHFLVIRAFERAEVSLIAPFAYTELIWATVAGLIVFGDFPDAFTIAGAVVIAGSGIYVLARERKRMVPATPAPPPE